MELLRINASNRYTVYLILEVICQMVFVIICAIIFVILNISKINMTITSTCLKLSLLFFFIILTIHLSYCFKVGQIELPLNFHVRTL